MRSVTTICDVKGCENEEAEAVVLPVIFVTEQTEGRSSKPHIDRNAKLDICSDCNQYMLEKREFLTAAGAQGNNRFWFASKEKSNA